MQVYPLQRIKDAEYSRIVNELDPSIRAQEDSEWRVYQSPHMTAGDDSKLHLIRPKPSPVSLSFDLFRLRFVPSSLELELGG